MYVDNKKVKDKISHLEETPYGFYIDHSSGALFFCFVFLLL